MRQALYRNAVDDITSLAIECDAVRVCHFRVPGEGTRFRVTCSPKPAAGFPAGTRWSGTGFTLPSAVRAAIMERRECIIRCSRGDAPKQ